MTVPLMYEVKTFEHIKAELLAIHQSNAPGYVPNESDETMPVLETFAYRELLLRTSVNETVRQSFWQTATGDNLDFHAGEFFIERDKGEMPTATVVFTLNSVLDSSYVLEDGIELINADGSVSLLLGDVVISAGMSEASGIAELQIYVAASDTKVVSTMVPKAYLASVVQTTAYAGGSDPMDDDALRTLIAMAGEQQTTAGSIQSYRYWARSSDSRINDVNVFGEIGGIVNVIIHSLVGVDETMISRVRLATSGDIHRPLNDTVNVRAASTISYTVDAVLTVSADSDAVSTIADAKVRLEERLHAVDIGKSVTLGMIIAALSVDGVEDVSLISPISTIGCGEDEVAIPTSVEVRVA